MSQLKLRHSFIILVVICSLAFVLLWLFHNMTISPILNQEIYLISMMYCVVMVVTAYALKNMNIGDIHKTLGFRKCTNTLLFYALLMALIIWTLNHFYQTLILASDVKAKATLWYMKQNNLTTVFISTVIMAPFIEELLFRGVFFKTLNRHFSPLFSALILSALFSILHLSWEQALPIFIASLCYFYLTYKSQSLYPAILAHILNNLMTYINYLSYQS